MDEMTKFVVYIGLIASSFGCDFPNNNCKNGSCHLSNAKPHCSIGCKDGFAGIFCNERCVYPCHACRRTNPRQCTRCEAGRFGTKCDSGTGFGQGFETSTSTSSNRCPKHCKDSNSPESRICNTTTGHCLYGCEEGFTGSDCQLAVAEGSGVSNVLQKQRASCPPLCLKCSDDGTCVKCPGVNGDICSDCGQDGGCLDECGTGCADKGSSPAESLVSNVSRDIWSQIDHLIKNNALMLPLLCCCVVLFFTIVVGVVLKCRVRKGTQRLDDPTFVAEIKEEPVFAKCGDIYHEIDDTKLDGRTPVPPPVQEIPRQHLSHGQGQGHSKKVHQSKSKHGGKGLNHRGQQGHRTQVTDQGQINTRGHNHDQVSMPHDKEGNVIHQYDYACNSTDSQSYITAIPEVTRADSSSTKDNNVTHVTPVHKVTESRVLQKPEQNDFIPRNPEGSSYMTAISEEEERNLIARSESCNNRDVNQSKPTVVVAMGCQGQHESAQLEENTDPEVTDPLLTSSSDTEEMPEIKLQCHVIKTSSQDSPFPRTGDCDVTKMRSQSACITFSPSDSFHSTCQDTSSRGCLYFENDGHDDEGYLLPKVKQV